MNPNHCPHSVPLAQTCDQCEAATRAARLDAVRLAAQTTHENATVTAGGLVVLCELLPADALAAKWLSLARPYQPDAAMMLHAGQLRGLLAKLTPPEPEPGPEPPPPGATE